MEHPLNTPSMPNTKNSTFWSNDRFQKKINCQKWSLFNNMQPHLDYWTKVVGPWYTRLYSPPKQVVKGKRLTYILGGVTSWGRGPGFKQRFGGGQKRTKTTTCAARCISAITHTTYTIPCTSVCLMHVERGIDHYQLQYSQLTQKSKKSFFLTPTLLKFDFSAVSHPLHLIQLSPPHYQPLRP